ncbi:hypothetical protein GCM10010324_42360 [Streptomyces hiroshimensis]|uniref:Uncharacterized protein n=1 Tax=Streptomyces hiroshimensis TaxID=66424 RepID=A0ABQ2YQK6_9ACTN|nr:hypothetical protein GCM10010324_42360 [Streptomyces hiroshimensis]
MTAEGSQPVSSGCEPAVAGRARPAEPQMYTLAALMGRGPARLSATALQVCIRYQA